MTSNQLSNSMAHGLNFSQYVGLPAYQLYDHSGRRLIIEPCL